MWGRQIHVRLYKGFMKKMVFEQQVKKMGKQRGYSRLGKTGTKQTVAKPESTIVIGAQGSWESGNRMGRQAEAHSGRSCYGLSVLTLGVETGQKEQKLRPQFVIHGEGVKAATNSQINFSPTGSPVNREPWSACPSASCHQGLEGQVDCRSDPGNNFTATL